MENRNELLYPEQLNPLPDKPIELPDKPVIWIANHAIKDDTLASVLAAKRNGYIIFGSLPQFYNTFDGISAWANGVIMTNRKVSSSKSSSIKKGIKVINNGSDLIMFPEGVWNKSPNKLLLDFWPGVYRIAKETDSKIVPMAHYIRDGAHKIPNNPIHTVIDDPVSISDMAEKEAVEIKQYSVIYQALEDVEAAMKGMLEPIYEEKVIGNAIVRQTFRVSGVGTIAGAYVSDGKIERNAGVRVIRENVVIHDGKLVSLKRFKDDAKEVTKGFECGLQIEGYNDVKEDDVLEFYIMEEVKR